jgi:hypothetical protein
VLSVVSLFTNAQRINPPFIKPAIQDYEVAILKIKTADQIVSCRQHGFKMILNAKFFNKCMGGRLLPFKSVK